MDWDRLAGWLTGGFVDVAEAEDPDATPAPAEGGAFRAVYLIWNLDDPDPEVRRSAAETLGELGDRQAVGALLRSLRDPEVSVREAAANSLARLGVDRDTLLAAAVRTAPRAGSRSTPPAQPSESFLLSALSDVDRNIRTWAVDELARRGAAAVPPLLAVLADGPILARESAAQALGEINDLGAVPGLLCALGHANSRVRAAAARALGGTCEPEASILGGTLVAPLVGALGDESSEVREAAGAALRQLDQSAVADAVLSALSGVPGTAIAAGDPRVAEPLIRALGHGDPLLRRNAAEALGLLGDARACEPLVTLLADWRSGLQDVASKALVRIGEPSVIPLIAALSGETESGRRVAAGVLSRMRPAVLVEVLAQGGPAAREAAAFALGGCAAPGAAEGLVRALQDEHGPVRRAAAEALVGAGEARAVAALAGALDDPLPMVRRAAADSLGRMGVPAGAALERLRGRRRDPSREVRDACAAAVRVIAEALEQAPAELEATDRPLGRGTEPEAAETPPGWGTELKANEEQR